MLRVVHANRLDQLAAALADGLPAAGDPFARPTIVVSGSLIARWVTFAIAEQRGIAAHLHLPFLEPFIAEIWTGDEVGRAARLYAMDHRKLGALAASVLADARVTGDDALAPVRDYLAEDDAGARQVRRVQLAQKIAGLVWEYAITRPEWLDAWEAGRFEPADGVDATTWAWQARIVRAMKLAGDALFDAGGARWIAAPRLPRARRALGLASPRVGGPVHVVGFSFLAPAYLDALGELGAHGDVTVYAQDPCEELWEDVAGRMRRPRPEAADDPRALALWGKPARDTIGRLVELSDGQIEGRFVDPGDETALAALRGDILHRRVSASIAREPGVTVLACPSVTRELEIVGSEIRGLLSREGDLAANRIAVLAAGPRADRYLAQLPAVFGALDLPYHVVDAPLAEHGRVAEAALLLLELPLGRFSRPELLRFMTHPAVLARHRHVDPDDWVEWAERLGIVHGASGDDHKGTYLEGLGALFHWDQGIRRLALGAFMDPGDPPAAVTLAGTPYLAEPVAPDQQASAATFALLARSLLADAAWLRARELPLARWAEILGALAETYVGARDELAARELKVVRGALADLAGLDLDERAVGYAEVVEIAKRTIGGLRGDRNEVLAHGVMVAPLAPGRALPTDYTFVVGLGEGELPDTAPRSPLDLRADVRRGDVSPGDRDRYAFLECVLAPDRGLLLSYVAHDLETGDPIAPSSLVLELAEMLAPHVGADSGAAALAAITVEHPLHRWDPRYDDGARTASAAPGRARERHAVTVRDRLIDALAARDRAVPEPAALADLLAAAPLPRLRAALRLGAAADLAAHARRDDDAPITVSLSALRRFLETPAQAWAQVVLRLADVDHEDPIDREDEPFLTPHHERAVYLREVFARHLGASGAPPSTISAALDAASDARVLTGRAPVGVFGDVERQRHRELLERWSAEVARRGGAAPWQRHAFGKSAGAGCERHAAITVEVAIGGRAREVELVGWTEIIGAGVGSLVLQPSKADDRHTLRGAFDAALLAATGIAETHAHLVLDRAKAYPMTHTRWPRADAFAWLRGLVEELLGSSHAYLLGMKQAQQLRKGKAPTLDHPTDATPGTLGYGPLHHDDDLDLPSDAAAIVGRRHAPLFARFQGDEP